MYLILQKIVFWFWRKSFSDFEENCFMIFSRFFPDFEENRFLIYKEIVSDFFTILFRFWRKSFFDFRENRFLIFSWFLETRFNKLICIRKNTEKIVCKSRDFNTILSTIYSTIFLVWVTFKQLKIEISYVYSLWQDLSHGTISLNLVTLTLKFDLLLKNFNLGREFRPNSFPWNPM